VKISQARFEGFEPLAAQWRALEADCPEAGFFQSWSWVGCLAEERYPSPVLLRAEAAGQTIGLALFNQHRGRLCLAENGAAMLDAPFIEHNGPLARDSRVAAALLRAAWQVPGMARLRLNGVAPALAEAAGGAMLRAQERLAPFVDLAALRRDGRDFLASRSANTRPYMAHAAMAVAPLHIGRGIQNKVLEAMAMGRPVIASPAAFEGILARPGQDLLVADGVAETQQAVLAVLAGEHPSLGQSARLAMERRYPWEVTLRRLDTFLPTRAPVAA
jgi:hypothetical protein